MKNSQVKNNPLEHLHNRFEIEEKRINEFEDKSIQMIQYKKKTKDLGEMNKAT